MANTCMKCGTGLRDGAAFCTQCGTRVASAIPSRPAVNPDPAQQRSRRAVSQTTQRITPQPIQRPVSQTVSQTAVFSARHEGTQHTAKKPAAQIVGTGAFFGFLFLFSIPVIGWLICIMMAFTHKNPNVRHFSRAILIWLIIALIISFLVGLAINALIQSATPYIEQITAAGTEELNGLIESGSLNEILSEIEKLLPLSAPAR